uniref:Uncharacterized protein n=1 Tax=Arundo donax TaxID=35708 RepID=A0A0A9GLB1_ARUDO
MASSRHWQAPAPASWPRSPRTDPAPLLALRACS